MKLYIVPTPVGNLGDITFRAIDVLKQVDVVLCEDTRTSGKLLKHYEISKPLLAYHQHNEHKVLGSLINKLKAQNTMALITDAGTPGISDPGFLLIRECIKNDIAVECLPGATAFVPALVVSGLPTHNFVFEGFLPIKKGRKTKLEQLAEEKRTIVLYESPHRIHKTLQELQTFFGNDRMISISREISKLHEETLRGTIEELAQHFSNHPAKGEIVMVISGS